MLSERQAKILKVIVSDILRLTKLLVLKEFKNYLT